MSGFERHARTVSILTLFSRLTGLARDAVTSRVLGAGPIADAFLFAFMVPNLLRRLFGEGALSAALLPVYTELDGRSPAAARRLGRLVLGGTLVILAAAVLIVIGVLLLARPETGWGRTATELAMVMLPYAPLVCGVALAGAMLQVHGRFGPAAMAPIILNGVIIFALVGPLHVDAVVPAGATGATVADVPTTLGRAWTAAIAVLVAGSLQLAWAWVGLRRVWRRGAGGGGAAGATGSAAHPERTNAIVRADARTAIRRIVRQVIPMVLGLGVLQLNTLVDGLIASWPTVVGPTVFGVTYPLEEGAMTAVTYAQRLYQFPLGVFGIAIATAIFPQLAREATASTTGAFLATVRRGMRLVVFIGLPASVGLVLVREPLARVVLEGGDFSEGDARRVARVLIAYAAAVWAYSLVHVLTRAFYARGESSVPVRVAVGVVGLNIVLNLILIWTPLREAGLAASTAICAVVQATALSILLRRRLGQLVDTDVHGSWGRSLGCTAVMIVVLFGVDLLFGRLAGADAASWTMQAVRLGILTVAGAAAYGGCAALLKRPELRWALGRS